MNLPPSLRGVWCHPVTLSEKEAADVLVLTISALTLRAWWVEQRDRSVIPRFEGTREDDSGKTVPVHAKAVEVLRRQPDGSWKLIMGDPNGRE